METSLAAAPLTLEETLPWTADTEIAPRPRAAPRVAPAQPALRPESLHWSMLALMAVTALATIANAYRGEPAHSFAMPSVTANGTR